MYIYIYICTYIIFDELLQLKADAPEIERISCDQMRESLHK